MLFCCVILWTVELDEYRLYYYCHANLDVSLRSVYNIIVVCIAELILFKSQGKFCTCCRDNIYTINLFGV